MHTAPPPYDDLHAPLLPILRRLLAGAGLPRAGLLLDLACGDMAKWPLYHAVLGGATRMIGIDDNRQALIHAVRASGADAMICADAQALPLAEHSIDGALCVAALGLFDEPRRALAELRRVLRPGAPALIVTAERRWALTRRWPADLAARIETVIAGAELPQAHADLTGEFSDLVAGVGLERVVARAFLLEDDLPPGVAELALLPWEMLPSDLAARLCSVVPGCRADIEFELELVGVVLAIVAYCPDRNLPDIR